ncbi:MAG: phage tail terminator-like protein [Burkholderiales bacterium]
MSDALVRAAFETRLAAWAAAQSPAIPVAWENSTFTPPTGRYVRCYLIPAPTECETFNGEHRRRMGVFQVSLCMSTGSGPAAANALAASLDATFPLSAPLAQGNIKVFLLSPMSIAPAIQENDHYVVPVSCTYRTDIIV